MVYNAQLTAQYDVSTTKYNFNNNFEYVKKYIEEADYSMVNLETTLTGNNVYRCSSYPKFNSPDEMADVLKHAGFDLVSIANNNAYATLKDKDLDIDISKSSTDEKARVEKVTCIPTLLNKYYNSETAKYVYEIISLANKSDLTKINNLSQIKIEKSYKNTASQVETSDLINIVKNPFD